MKLKLSRSPLGDLDADSSENKSLKKPLQHGRLTDKKNESLKKTLQDGQLTYKEDESLKNQLQHGRLTNKTLAPAGPPADPSAMESCNSLHCSLAVP